MKNMLLALLIISAIMPLGCAFSESTAASDVPASIKSNIVMSTKAAEPAVNDSTQSVILEFREPFNFETVSGEVKLYRMKSTGEAVEEPIVLNFDPNAPMLLNISRKDGSKFTEGEEYKSLSDNPNKFVILSRFGVVN